MTTNITTLSVAVGIVSLAITLIQRMSTAAIDTTSFRTRWFFRGRLADIKLALEHLPDGRKGALSSMIDARIFRFMFGFYGSSQMRDAIFKALEAGQLSEGQVKACSWKLSLSDNQKLQIKPQRRELIEASIYLGFCILMLSLVILLIIATGAEKHIDPIALVLGLLVSVMGFALAIKMLSDFLDVLTVRRTRKYLDEENQKRS